MNAACPHSMTTLTDYTSTMPTISLPAKVIDNPKTQMIKRAQDLPNVDEFRAQREWLSVRFRVTEDATADYPSRNEHPLV